MAKVSSLHEPLVSIITPSYNQAKFIEETILSVKGQDYFNLEHIVTDGGSTDGTVDILRRYEDEYNLSWVSEPDEGQSDAINKGFQMAKGKIIGWVNSDDTYMPGAIRTAVTHLLAHPEAGWVYGDGYWIDKDSHIGEKWKSRHFDLKVLIAEGQYIVQPTVFFRRSLLEIVGYLDTELHFTMDTDFFMRLAVAKPALYIQKVLATRRIHDQAKTFANISSFFPDRIKALDKLFQNSGIPPDIAKLRKRAYSSAFFESGFQLFGMGEFQQARSQLIKALRLDPSPYCFKTIKILLLIAESYMGLCWYDPAKRSRTKKCRLLNRAVSVSWKSGQVLNHAGC